MKRYLVGFSVSLGILGCGPSVEEPLAARYKDRYLTRDEVLQRVVVPAGADTTAIVRAYAMAWVRQQALADTAYALLPALRPQIEAQVQDYRNKLLVLYLSRMLLEEGSYAEISDSVMRAFYQAQAQAFRAMTPLYKWRWVQVPATWAAQLEVRQNLSLSDSAWLRWIEEKRYQGVRSPDWTPRLDSLPGVLSGAFIRPASPGVQPRCSAWRARRPYYLIFQLTGKILAGQILPYDLARDHIRRILIQQASELVWTPSRKLSINTPFLTQKFAYFETHESPYVHLQAPSACRPFSHFVSHLRNKVSGRDCCYGRR